MLHRVQYVVDISSRDKADMLVDLSANNLCGVEVVGLCSRVLSIPIVVFVQQPQCSSGRSVFFIHAYGVHEMPTTLHNVMCLMLADNHYQVRLHKGCELF